MYVYTVHVRLSGTRDLLLLLLLLQYNTEDLQCALVYLKI